MYGTEFESKESLFMHLSEGARCMPFLGRGSMAVVADPGSQSSSRVVIRRQFAVGCILPY